ncbi:phage major capsid protein [Clostridium thermobutyricum]|uniref:Phage capsid family protein n=1 Tax=Clostridium thermobutyricum DSM 4928 TaxID=1121339 RepID=A0A1V4T092_9CLOT|nr:phage major capsid protein [Clostridium thermobutyricum]OPX50906.1 phage capsid family protein [Clostridium thermobutyricum DSM 4928]
MKRKILREEIVELTSELRGFVDNKEVEKAKEIREKIIKKKEELRREEEIAEIEKQKLIAQARGVKLEEGRMLNTDSIKLIEKRQSFYDNVIKRNENTKRLSIGKYVKGMLMGDWDGAKDEMIAYRSLNTTTGATIIPNTLSANIIDLARPKMALGDIPIIPMDTNNITIAKIKEDPKFGFKAELQSVESSAMTFEPIELKSKMVYGLMQISLELLESAQNIDSIIQEAMSNAIAQAIDEKGLYGKGVQGNLTTVDLGDEQKVITNEPKGILTYDTINTIESDNINSTKYVSFIKGIGEITKANGTPNIITYNSNIDTEISLLTDSTGQPLNAPKKMETMNYVISNNIQDNQALIYDSNAIVMGIQNRILLEVSRDKGFSDGSVWFRAYAMVDFAVLKPKHITKITYKE